MLIKKLIKKFNNYKIYEENDTLSNYNITFQTDSIPSLDGFYEIKNLLYEYPDRDLFNMCIKSSDDDFFYMKHKNSEIIFDGPEYIVKDNNDINEILNKFNDLSMGKDKFEVKIIIDKEYISGIISIYSLENFTKWIVDKDTYGVIRLFSQIYDEISYLEFISYDGEIEIQTETFRISTEEKRIKGFKVDRKRILDSRLDITNIQGMELNIIPEDFNIIEYKHKDKGMKKLIDGIRNLLSIIYISDISIIGNRHSVFRITGYKNTEFEINYDDIYGRDKNNQLYKIYKWIYNDGNLIDKSTIARNIVSLHCRYQNILELDEENLNSIKTNYSYYLKTNTDEFLEEKKNLRLSIIEEGKVLSEALYGLISNMGKNLLAYFTFLATLVISNTLVDGKLSDIFTFETVQIIAAIILGSFLFLIFSNIETNYKRKRMMDYVEDLTVGYGVMLGEDNALEIINNVKSYKTVKDTFIKKQIILSLLWGSFNILLLLMLDWISKDIKIFGVLNIF